MPGSILPVEAERAIDDIAAADLVVGIPSYNNARTISHVVRAAHAGLTKYFPQLRSVIVDCDAGSNDGTSEAVLSTRLGDHLLMLSTPMYPADRLSSPYHGNPGRARAIRMIFAAARRLGAKVCILVDPGLRSITPEWIDLLGRPILYGGYDLAAPHYRRHKYDGTITSSIVYPMTRVLYRARLRQSMGGDFGISTGLIKRYLDRDDWDTDVPRYAIDLWMTTIAIAEEYRVAQSFLGSKLQETKEPAAGLSATLHQVAGSLFTLMEEYFQLWSRIRGSRTVEQFGIRMDDGLDPFPVDTGYMVNAFRVGCSNLGDVWSLVLHPDTHEELLAVERTLEGRGRFHLPDELWARVLIEFSAAQRVRPLERSHLLRSLTPLYLARVASFVLETEHLNSKQVEAVHERFCRCLEEMKPYATARWKGEAVSAPERITATYRETDESRSFDRSEVLA